MARNRSIIPARGIEQIRGRTCKGQSANKHKVFLRMMCLEMERSRRLNERESLSGRLEVLDARLGEIETEISGLILSEKRDRTDAPEGSANQIGATKRSFAHQTTSEVPAEPHSGTCFHMKY
jgi:hypothetical protein